MNMNRVLAALLLPLLVVAAGCRERAVKTSNAPVIIISVDTLRADHLPAYGYTKVETPSIDALRKDSLLFTHAYSNVPLTFPSHVSVLTGLLPPAHGVRNNIGYHLDPKIPTIPAALKARGYETGAAVSSYVLRGNVGLAPSFDYYDDAIVSHADVPVGELQRRGDLTVASALQWIAPRKDKPFFFLLHLYEPHSPYTPVEPFRSRYSSTYDGEIATSDAILGRFLQQLKDDGIYDKALIIFMSDHGEGLYEHGEPEHGIFLYREDIHVPLIVKLPSGARAGETDDTVVSLTDIFPTVAAVTGAALPGGAHGVSLLGHAKQKTPRSVYSETLYPRIHLGWSELRSLVEGDHHFIQAPKPELYDMRSDPGEKQNVLADQRRVYARLRDELAKYGTSIEMPKSIDPEEAKKLAALGYLGSAAPATSGPLPDPKDRIGEVAAMMKAMQLSREGRRADAAAALRQIVAANPGFTDAWNQLGSELETMDRYDEAVQAYRAAIERSPDLAGEFGLRLASLYLKLERLDDAEKHARLGEKTNFGGSHMLLARIALAKKDYRTAESEAKIAAGDQFTRVPARVLLAQMYAQQDRAREAYEIVQDVSAEAARRNLGKIESLDFVRGDALARMQRFDEAIPAFRSEIANFPNHRQPYASLYLVYMLTNRPADAQRVLEDMVRANPSKRAYAFAITTVEAVGDQRAAAMWRQREAEAF